MREGRKKETEEELNKWKGKKKLATNWLACKPIWNLVHAWSARLHVPCPVDLSGVTPLMMLILLKSVLVGREVC